MFWKVVFISFKYPWSASCERKTAQLTTLPCSFTKSWLYLMKKITERNCIVAVIPHVASLPKNMWKRVQNQTAFWSSGPPSFWETLRLTFHSSHRPRTLVPSSGCILRRPSEHSISSIFTISQFALCFWFNTTKSLKSFLVWLNLRNLCASSVNRGDNTPQH